MLMYEILSSGTIEVDLKNGYKVIVFGNYIPSANQANTYELKMLLGSNEFDTYQLVTKDYNNTIISSPKAIRYDMAEFVTKLHENDFFGQLINTYKYEQNCLLIGDEVLDVVHRYDK